MRKQVVMLKIGWVVVAALGLGAWTGAEPVKTEDNKTGRIVILDKTTGQKVFVAKQKLIYASGKLRWEKTLKGNERFVDALINRENIVVVIYSGHGTFLRCYGTDGN